MADTEPVKLTQVKQLEAWITSLHQLDKNGPEVDFDSLFTTLTDLGKVLLGKEYQKIISSWPKDEEPPIGKHIEQLKIAILIAQTLLERYAKDQQSNTVSPGELAARLTEEKTAADSVQRFQDELKNAEVLVKHSINLKARRCTGDIEAMDAVCQRLVMLQAEISDASPANSAVDSPEIVDIASDLFVSPARFAHRISTQYERYHTPGSPQYLSDNTEALESIGNLIAEHAPNHLDFQSYLSQVKSTARKAGTSTNITDLAAAKITYILLSQEKSLPDNQTLNQILDPNNIDGASTLKQDLQLLQKRFAVPDQNYLVQSIDDNALQNSVDIDDLTSILQETTNLPSNNRKKYLQDHLSFLNNDQLTVLDLEINNYIASGTEPALAASQIAESLQHPYVFTSSQQLPQKVLAETLVVTLSTKSSDAVKMLEKLSLSNDVTEIEQVVNSFPEHIKNAYNTHIETINKVSQIDSQIRGNIQSILSSTQLKYEEKVGQISMQLDYLFAADAEQAARIIVNSKNIDKLSGHLVVIAAGEEALSNSNLTSEQLKKAQTIYHNLHATSQYSQSRFTTELANSNIPKASEVAAQVTSTQSVTATALVHSPINSPRAASALSLILNNVDITDAKNVSDQSDSILRLAQKDPDLHSTSPTQILATSREVLQKNEPGRTTASSVYTATLQIPFSERTSLQNKVLASPKKSPEKLYQYILQDKLVLDDSGLASIDVVTTAHIVASSNPETKIQVLKDILRYQINLSSSPNKISQSAQIDRLTPEDSWILEVHLPISKDISKVNLVKFLDNFSELQPESQYAIKSLLKSPAVSQKALAAAFDNSDDLARAINRRNIGPQVKVLSDMAYKGDVTLFQVYGNNFDGSSFRRSLTADDHLKSTTLLALYHVRDSIASSNTYVNSATEKRLVAHIDKLLKNPELIKWEYIKHTFESQSSHLDPSNSQRVFVSNGQATQFTNWLTNLPQKVDQLKNTFSKANLTKISQTIQSFGSHPDFKSLLQQFNPGNISIFKSTFKTLTIGAGFASLITTGRASPLYRPLVFAVRKFSQTSVGRPIVAVTRKVLKWVFEKLGVEVVGSVLTAGVALALALLPTLLDKLTLGIPKKLWRKIKGPLGEGVAGSTVGYAMSLPQAIGNGIATGAGSLLSLVVLIVGATIGAIVTPVVIALLAIPISIAFFLFVITSSSYVVPPSTGVISSDPANYGVVVFPPGPGGAYPQCWPIKGWVVQGPPGTGCPECSHENPNQNAIDISTGGIVYATHDGIAHTHNWDGITTGYGNYIDLISPLGFTTRYAHLNKISVLDNTPITAGTGIGIAGTSGHVPLHLHYELRPWAISVASIVPGYPNPTKPTERIFPPVSASGNSVDLNRTNISASLRRFTDWYTLGLCYANSAGGAPSP